MVTRAPGDPVRIQRTVVREADGVADDILPHPCEPTKGVLRDVGSLLDTDIEDAPFGIVGIRHADVHK